VRIHSITLLGIIKLTKLRFSGGAINPDWFALFESRGLDDITLKTFMRATALASELLTYVPAVVFFVRAFGRQADLSKYDKVWE